MATKLGIIAGGGELPARLIEVCRATGREVFVIAFEGQTEPATVAGVEHAWIRLGRFGGALEALKGAGVEDLVLIGPIKRPRLGEFGLDLRAARWLAKVGAQGLGDDGLLRAVIGALEEEGFRVLGADDLLGGLLAPAGPLGAHRPDAGAESDIARGLVVAKALGEADVGQAVVVQQGIVLGVEAVEGTDRLLMRCAELGREGPGGVLVKIKKPGQERRVDLPTVGVQTVAGAARARLRGIAVEAGGTLIVDRLAVVRTADAAGLFILGIDVPAVTEAESERN
jgi:DUF1009 family protein